MFLERAIHAFIWSQGFSNHVLICVYYFGSLVFRTSHTCITLRAEEDRWASARRVYMYLSVPNFSNHVLICVFQPRRVLIRVYCFGSRVFRTSHYDMPCSLSCPFLLNFSNRYFDSRIVRTSHTCVLPFRFQLRLYMRLLFRLTR